MSEEKHMELVEETNEAAHHLWHLAGEELSRARLRHMEDGKLAELSAKIWMAISLIENALKGKEQGT